MAFKGRLALSYLEINVDRFNKTMEEEVNIQLRQAVRAWLTVLVEEGAIPVWTGTAKGVFIPLGKLLRVAVPIRPIKSKPGFGPEVGAKRSSFAFNRVGNKYTFEFLHDVGYLAANEEANLRPPIKLRHPGPYNAFKRAGEAYDKYVDENFEKRMSNRVLAKVTRFREYNGGYQRN